MTKLMNRFLKDESGATAIEYGLIAALISTVIVVAATGAGTALDTTFQGIETDLGGGGNN